jgi:UDP-glucose 4-epimerase
LKKVLISGCAGYIGSILSQILIEQGIEVLGIDNFSASSKENLNPQIKFYESCISNQNIIDKICNENQNIDCVFHLASFSTVEESIAKKDQYLSNNYDYSVLFLEQLIKNKVNNFVFASTASVYAGDEADALKETSSLKPNSPYGKSKLDFENFLKKQELNYAILRLFNVSGSYKDLGEAHQPETHLIPCIVDALLKQETIKIYGDDFDTKDGTAIRDYIHVVDVANAFINSAIKLLETSLNERIFNIGSSITYSNLEVLKLVENLVDKKLDYKIEAKRVGDVACLKADNQAAINSGILKLENSNLGKIIIDNIDTRKKLVKN